ncbi:MAG: hypothetical protein AWU59_1637 [Methanolobus sp. T82-4]|nr:MAG: hypothetical protein AWU59_1637 [Methanolobus sp. T82-4]
MREEQNMSKANQFLKEEDAVSPVIGVILMVAITVTLAAVIAAFVFGMGPPEQAPQASLRASADTIKTGIEGIKLEHQGGDAVVLTDARTKVTLDGNEVDILLDATNQSFDAGEVMYVFNDDGNYYLDNYKNTSSSNLTDVVSAGETANLKLIDVSSQQMIADMKVNF